MPRFSLWSADPTASEAGPGVLSFLIKADRRRRAGVPTVSGRVSRADGGPWDNSQYHFTGSDFEVAADGTFTMTFQNDDGFSQYYVTSPVIMWPIDDDVKEPTQHLEVELTGVSWAPGTVDSTPLALTVTDDDQPYVGIYASDPAAHEDYDQGAFTAWRTGDVSEALTVPFTVSGLALEGIDFQPLGNEITFPAGEREVHLPLLPIDDDFDELVEDVVVELLPVSCYVFLQNPARAEIDDILESVPKGHFL